MIRTGAHCFLTKVGVFRKLGKPPWFRTRLAQVPVQAFREVDNFARTKLAGQNPLTAHPEWETLLEAAKAASTGQEATVGEDSAFFDRCRAHNVPCYVDTDLITGHVANDIIMPQKYAEKVRESRKLQRIALGVG